MKRYRPLLAMAVLILTVIGFVYYFHKHPGTIHQLTNLSPATIVGLLAMYCLTAVSLIIILDVSLQLCNVKMGYKENLLLTIYSTVVNFFGPLQSGPGVRAIYLKKRHNVGIKNFLLVSLVYYCFFAFISAVFLLVVSRPWWQTTILLIAAIIAIFFGYKLVKKKMKITQEMTFSPDLLVKLFLATLLQLSLVAIIYFIELHVVNKHISFGQAVTYTGAANFALFVSLTPGAIGFRESFLLLSHRLHHISTSNVLAASLIDRAIYIVFLGLLLILALGLHARDRLNIKSVLKEGS
jgi:uncharacterized membrane protein YbhN (UPF0104 family)